MGDNKSSSGLCCLAQLCNALQRLPAAFKCLPGFLSIHIFVTEKITAVLTEEEGIDCQLLFAVAIRGLWSRLAKSDFP